MNKLLSDLPEQIETPRLILQMPKAGLGQKLHEAIIDGYDDYIKWLNWPKTPPSINETEEECRKHHAEFILRDFIRYIIIEKDTQELIGRCAFPPFQLNWIIPQFSISYFVSKGKRSKNYATEAAHAMALLAFDKLHARKVEIFCDSKNVASCQVPIKLGFTLEYTKKGGWPTQDDALASIRCYSLFAKKELIAPSST